MSIKKKVYRVLDLATSVIANRKEVFVKGYSCGFKGGDDLISYRIGYTTGIYSYSAQGKSQFYIEQAVYLSKRYGLKHAIWLTESGRKEEIILDIAMTYMGKSLFSVGVFISDDDIFDAMTWLNDHFFIVDHESSILNIREIYKNIADYEAESGIKIDCVAIDNASNLSREADKSRMQTHDYMNYLMTAVNRTSLLKKYHTFILFHVSKTDTIECKTTNKKYQPLPDHYSISGGQQINYLGYQLVCVWRPISKPEQEGIIDPNTGSPFELNETHISISKSKPKGVGNQGIFKLYFDKDRQQYYEMYMGNKYYAGEYESRDLPLPPKTLSPLQPNRNFESETEDNPF